MKQSIQIKGARQHNLKNLSLDLPLGQMIVVTGVSGAGKSSLVFDTVYAEGQRRYVETFSPYARQFLDRMDKPQVDAILGIPPAIAIDQSNPVRTSRSTVGTMTELNDYLKLLFARTAQLHCRQCGQPVTRDTADAIAGRLFAAADCAGQRLEIVARLPLQSAGNAGGVMEMLASQGYTRVRAVDGTVEVTQDRMRLRGENASRLREALEHAFRLGHGKLVVRVGDEGAARELPFSSGLHCAACDIGYQDVTPNSFSFNSPVGACATCRGFGRTIGIDYRLVVPDENRTLAQGAVKPWQTPSFSECQRDLERYARKRKVRLDVPWRDLTPAERAWVTEGEGDIDSGSWYGIDRFFGWLESKSYKMHLRVLLSKYRSYDTCRDCHGARLKPDSLLWRVHGPGESFDFHELTLLPISSTRDLFAAMNDGAGLDEATALVLQEIRTRLDFLVEVGLGYLSLDRQSRTLSGGEVQRINLTTALGTSLVNTLFVLDEPSIGLHPRDVGNVVGVLHRLRDAGNTLLVVEHDPQVMLAADQLIDMGPGPGKAGGEIVYRGAPGRITGKRASLTAQYLRGEREIVRGAHRPVAGNAEWLRLRGVHANNLKHIDAAIPLGHLVCVSGVSGSGKSTLVVDVLFQAVAEALGKQAPAPLDCAAVEGVERVTDIVLVDQAPIGKSARSNPASYVGAWNAIRALFAAAPLALDRGYTPGTFSFNAGTGRCPACNGSGFEHVEMQFLSDVYLRCGECNGLRFRPEVLEVRIDGGHSIADVLQMTVAEAIAHFASQTEVVRALAPLREVGLDYLTLGQPVPTLSGGEAQRLKLAAHLAQSNDATASGKGVLFVFDEPTTGLHFDDIAKLMRAWERLLAQGHTVLVIEHNLDVIRSADWLLDLGPEGGEAGGELVFAGKPEDSVRCGGSHTGRALESYLRDRVSEPPPPRPVRAALVDDRIRIQHAREHNLRDIDVEIPRDAMTVITGISGSGKSTIAFDILFAEGQRRYLESLNAYARQFVQPASRPDVDSIRGIPPTVAVEQRTSRGGRKSTVATLTEVYHYLRLLFVKLGTQYCPDCALPIDALSLDSIVARVLRDFRNRRVEVLAPLVVSRKGYYTELARRMARLGYAELRVDGVMTPTNPWPRLDRYLEHSIELPVGTLVANARNEAELRTLLARALQAGDGNVQVMPAGASENEGMQAYSTTRACPRCQKGFPELDPRLFSYNSRQGWCESCYGTGLALEGFNEEQSGEERWWAESNQGEVHDCADCEGHRLNPQARAVRLWDRGIADYNAMTVDDARVHFADLRLDGRELGIAQDVLPELNARLGFLCEVGLGYLTLDRSAPTLSGGEAQRIRLAAQLGSNLRGVCYILDEPTIGLHPRDNTMLLDTLANLRDKGNTVVVVEHDEETMRRADHVLDLGPGAGRFGGEVVASGTLAQVMRSTRSLTARYLREPLRHPLTGSRRPVAARGKVTPWLQVRGASLHNLHRFDTRIPLGRLVCLSGVSGSGKSTLLRGVLEPNLQARVGQTRRRAAQPWIACREITGWESLKRVIEVDQTPIGKTPRSCPATYIGIWDAIRKLYANTAEARLRGFTASRFSFNADQGRCATCEGQGVRHVEMNFLPDVDVPCEDCGGARFNAETLEVQYRDRSIADVLGMSAAEACEFFAAHRAIHRSLQLMCEVGLDYLRLGQPSPTLSGGEAQRIKLVTELSRVGPLARDGSARQGDTLYLLDEPTVGLHTADVERLLHVLQRLVDNGNTVLVIEHNLEVLAEADWILDLGPEGGRDGGRLVAAGTPEQLAAQAAVSHTGKALVDVLAR